jgi:acetyl-CoA C-acetyltransferase
MAESSYLVAAARTPVGRFLGGLASVTAPQLAAVALRAALLRANLSADRVDEVILGNVLSAGVGQAPARQAALEAGCPPTVAALTINKVCGSGLKAVMLADQAIRAGDASVVVAGGMESMSRAPHLLLDARRGWKLGHQSVVDSMQHDGLWCATENVLMGELTDATARQCGITREDQDALAAESHRRAVAASDDGLFDDEIAPVTIASKRGERVVSQDEGPRRDCDSAMLAQLRPAFGKDGTATAGNASQISDGAAVVVVASKPVADELASPLTARVVATATYGVEPRDLFLAPVGAVRLVCEKAGVALGDVDLIELNEAFASQALACARQLELDLARVNVHGGAIALGHPIGASGARVLVTLLHAMRQRGAALGLASLCLGGGNAVAMLVERLRSA